MAGLADRYEQGQHVQAWTDALALGDLPTGTSTDGEVEQLLDLTMQRVRHNIEVLIEGLSGVGWRFEADEPLIEPSPSVKEELDGAEEVFGPIPRALRTFATEVGQVNLNGTLPSWDLYAPDPLVIETPIDYWLSEYELWQEDMGTEWERPGPFILELAPDRLHKADISGGAPYGMAVPNSAIDSLLIGEHHQTTLVNYLRICFKMAGMGGLDLLADDLEVPSELSGLSSTLVAI